MTNGFVGIAISDVSALISKLEALPDAMQEAATEDVATYLVNVLRLSPPQKSVSRADAYPDAPAGPGWFSEKQRRWFFWALNSGELQIPYRRTQAIAQGWQILGSGKNTIIVNEAPGVVFVHDDNLQSRHEAMVGWKKIRAILEERTRRMDAILDGAAKKAKKKVGLR